MSHFLKLSLIAAALFSLSSISGCTYQKVNVWQRAHLANPVMVRDASSAQASLEQHAYSAKEATAGGYTTGAGGCGCN